jgi:hypothetical protein
VINDDEAVASTAPATASATQTTPPATGVSPYADPNGRFPNLKLSVIVPV